MLELTYSLRNDAPPAMAWDRYAALVQSEWSKLLANAEVSEPEVHEYRYPMNHEPLRGGAQKHLVGERGVALARRKQP